MRKLLWRSRRNLKIMKLNRWTRIVFCNLGNWDLVKETLKLWRPEQSHTVKGQILSGVITTSYITRWHLIHSHENIQQLGHSTVNAIHPKQEKCFILFIFLWISWTDPLTHSFCSTGLFVTQITSCMFSFVLQHFSYINSIFTDVVNALFLKFAIIAVHFHSQRDVKEVRS